jgi:phosphonate utilization transcriptional regulator
MESIRSALQIIKTDSLAKAVQDEFVRLITEGVLQSGSKLTESEMALRLGVSRGPVREAFRALEEAGLLRFAKNRGVFVREVTEQDVVELYEVRAGLDDTAGRLLAPIITNSQVEELRSAVEAMEVSFSHRDWRNYFPLNLKFHDRIVEMTRNRKLLEMYRRLVNEMHLMRRRGMEDSGGPFVANDEHRDIVAALASRDGERAAHAMRSHVVSGEQRVISLLEGVKAEAPDMSDR